MTHILKIVFLFLAPVVSYSQILNDSKVKVTACHGEPVELYVTEDCSHCYYYLPSFLKVSRKADTKIPEASLVTWRNDKDSKVIGGILHVLVEWGITEESEQCVKKMVRTKIDSLGVIMGPVSVRAIDSLPVIKGNDKLATLLKASLTNAASRPTIPGAKMGLSFKFSEAQIDEFLYYQKNPDKAKAFLQIAYAYDVNEYVKREPRQVLLTLPFSEILKLVKEQ